jgi:uncharacterized membrane protein YhfC
MGHPTFSKFSGEVSGSLPDPFHIITAIAGQLSLRSLVYKIIRDTQSFYLGEITILCHKFNHGRA